MKWYAIYTKPGSESIVCEKLSRLEGIDVLNPIIREKRFFKQRLTLVESELFPCYLFARFDLERYYHMIKYTRGIKRILGTKTGIPFIVDDHIVDSITERIVDGFVQLDMPKLQSGDNIYVKDGPLKGFNGVFLSQTKPSERVTILLDAINYQGKIEIDRSLVAKT